jgi:small multidrug resistance pump
LGIAYAVWSGVGLVLISIVGSLYHHQHLDLPAVVGIGLIMVGVLVINLYSKSVAH